MKHNIAKQDICTTYRDCPSCGYKNSLTTTQSDGRTLYHCHVGCSQQDLMRVIRGHEPSTQRPRWERCQQVVNEANKTKAKRFALELWQKSRPVDGTVVASYLASRGLVGVVPSSLRFLPNHPHKLSGTRWPVMLAAVTDCAGRLQAVHRTYLACDGKGKAPVEQAKMTLAAVGGFSCHLAPAAEELAVAEGLETAFSVQLATGIPAWAALSAGGVRNLILPPLPSASSVTICADNDANGCGQRAAHAAAQRWQEEGRRVKVTMPPVADMDFNDVLMEAVR